MTIPVRIPFRYAEFVATEQIAVRLSPALVAALDDLVGRGVYDNRAEAVRAGIETLAAIDQRRGVDDAIVAGYRRTPPTTAERSDALASLREAIAQEPW